MTWTRSGTLLGSLGAGFVLHLATGLLEHKQKPVQGAQPTISAPAATTADIAALREHFDEKFKVVDQKFQSIDGRLGSLDVGLAGVKGYEEARRAADLQKALEGRR